nr:protein phosphatase 1 regulatory subunit 12A-like [Salvelinus alpinus]
MLVSLFFKPGVNICLSPSLQERRALERKISDMEEELKNLPEVKQVQALRQVKERLQAENRALARVVVKLSQSACSQLPPSVDL